MSPAICVHALGELRQTVSARLAGEQYRVFKEGCVRGGRGELGTERAIRAECGATGDQRSAGNLPERAGATVAKRHLIPFRQVEELAQTFTNRSDQLLAGAWRCDVPSRVVAPASSAAICSGRILLGPEPKRPSSGFSDSGILSVIVMVSRVDQCWGISRIMLGVRDYCGVTAEFRGAGRQWWQCGMQCRMYAAHHGYGVSE